MAQAVVDPAELRRFAANLKRFCGELQAALGGLHSQYLALGDTWRDQEYERFRQEFDRAWRQGEAREGGLVVIGCTGLDRAAVAAAVGAAAVGAAATG